MPHFVDLVDLAAQRLGGAAIAANDEFFAPKENLVKPDRAVFDPHRYTDRGKEMDGWETRRKRGPGHDWCVVRLGLPGVIRGVDVDTSWFRGNYPEACSIDACVAPAAATADELGDAKAWHEILPRSPLLGDTRNLFPIHDGRRFTHVRLNIHPDGGVARLRVHGEVVPDPEKLAAREVDLAALENGGLVLTSSNAFFGGHQNLIWPGRASYMGDGWETQRRRGPGHDWVVLRLAARGILQRIEVDTNHFKGNYPDRCSLELVDAPGATIEALTDARRLSWTEVLGETKLSAHTQHVFDRELTVRGPATHARLRIYPDGGVSRLRLWGAVAP